MEALEGLLAWKQISEFAEVGDGANRGPKDHIKKRDLTKYGGF